VAYAGKKTSRLSESALSVLPLVFYLGLSIALMVLDQRGGYGVFARERLALVAEPFWLVASSPLRAWRWAREEFALRGSLQDDNARKTRELALARARLHQLEAVASENRRLRGLLGGTRGYSLDVKLVGIADVDVDPSRRRLVLDGGEAEGVQLGQALVDDGGVVGQVISVSRHRAIALLVTDPDHAVPVQAVRSGLRTIAYGTGSDDRLSLPNIPQSADVRNGDLLVTSGIGGRFPAGFPVGRVYGLKADQQRLFLTGSAKPTAHFDRGNEVLLVSYLPPDADVGPPAPAGANAVNLAATDALLKPVEEGSDAHGAPAAKPASTTPATPARIAPAPSPPTEPAQESTP
jgi:rod shape-determining protein MreC